MNTASASLCLSALLAIGLSTASADGQSAPGAEKMKALLIQSPGWTANYSDFTQRGNNGAVDVVFEAREEKVVAKIRDVVHNRSCEREVTITTDSVQYDGCADSGITLHFDPDDAQFPFKGTSKTGLDYKLQKR